MGGLIALFERAVGLYASLVGINAYHQPGVEAGKKAASAILAVRKKIVDHLQANQGTAQSASQIAEGIGHPDKETWVYKILESTGESINPTLSKESRPIAQSRINSSPASPIRSQVF